MQRTAVVNAVIAKHSAASTEGSESASESIAPPPPDGTDSGVDSGSTNAEAVDGETTTATGSAPTEANSESSGEQEQQQTDEAATSAIDHEELRAKLERDRARRQAKLLRRQAREEALAAARAREQAEAEAAKWQSIGKSRSWLEAVKEAGFDPKEAFSQMQEEARKAGTPEAQIQSLERAMEQRLNALLQEHVEPLKRTLEQITAERDQLRQQAAEHEFRSTFVSRLADARYQPLLEEYDEPDLYRLAVSLRDDPDRLVSAAQHYKVPLTGPKGSVTIVDILEVMRAVQAAHRERMQRRKQSAASQESGSGKAPREKTTTVNGTAERNAGTIGNDLAATTASEADRLRSMTRAERVAYLARKYG